VIRDHSANRRTRYMNDQCAGTAALHKGGHMARLERYSSPAHLPDFEKIPGQCQAWHDFVLDAFKGSIATEAAKLKAVAKDGDPKTQFFSAVEDDYGPTVDQPVVWNAFPKELLRRYGRARALVEADNLWPLSAYRFDWRYDSRIPGRTGAGTPGIDLPDK
jgi:hypothetical protein